jgi:hypothetical protein
MTASSVTGIGNGSAFPGNKLPPLTSYVNELIHENAILNINNIKSDSTGNFSINQGSNVTITPIANGISISSSGGGGGTAGFLHVVYVDPQGNDSTGNGTLSAPFQTVTHALNNLPSGISLTNPAAILLGAGQFTEATLALKPNVALIGLGYRATRLIVTGGNITLDTSGGNYTTNTRSSIFGMSLSGSTGLSFDVSALPFSSFVFDMAEAWVNGSVTFTGRVGGADYCQLYRGYVFGSLNITNGQGELSDLTVVGNAHITCAAMTGGGNTEYDIVGGRVGGTVTYTSDGSRNQLATFINSNISTISASGTGTVISADVSSLPASTSITLTGGATLNRLTPTANLVAVPSTATSTGMTGDYAVNSSFAYFCIGTNTWVRTAVATF